MRRSSVCPRDGCANILPRCRRCFGELSPILFPLCPEAEQQQPRAEGQESSWRKQEEYPRFIMDAEDMEAEETAGPEHLAYASQAEQRDEEAYPHSQTVED